MSHTHQNDWHSVHISPCDTSLTISPCTHTIRIVPQAICTRFGMAIGYYCSPLVFLLMAFLFPIAFPIAKLLDCILGKDHSTFFRRAG